MLQAGQAGGKGHREQILGGRVLLSLLPVHRDRCFAAPPSLPDALKSLQPETKPTFPLLHCFSQVFPPPGTTHLIYF